MNSARESAFKALIAPMNSPAAAVRPPSAFVMLSPNAFCKTWPDRPTSDVKIGLRTNAEADLDDARTTAAEFSWRMHPLAEDIEARIECYNCALMRHVVARGTTAVNDVTLPYWGCAEDNLPLALTPEAIKYVYEHIEQLHIVESPIAPLIDDVEATMLVDILNYNGADLKLPPGTNEDTWPARRRAALRFLRCAVDQLRGST